MAALARSCSVWQPARIWRLERERRRPPAAAPPAASALVIRAWTPWIILSVLVFVWGMPQTVRRGSTASRSPRIPVPGLHDLVQRVPPVVADAKPEAGDLRRQLAVGDRHRASSSRRSSPAW